MKEAISIQQPRGSAWQRIRWQYVSLAAGLALAATAALALRGAESTATQPATRGKAITVALNAPAPQSPATVVFYLATNDQGASLAETYEEMARWVRYDNGWPEPQRSVVILDASSEEKAHAAYKLIEEAMAAANFTDSQAPTFVIAELR